MEFIKTFQSQTLTLPALRYLQTVDLPQSVVSQLIFQKKVWRKDDMEDPPFTLRTKPRSQLFPAGSSAVTTQYPESCSFRSDSSMEPLSQAFTRSLQSWVMLVKPPGRQAPMERLTAPDMKLHRMVGTPEDATSTEKKTSPCTDRISFLWEELTEIDPAAGGREETIQILYNKCLKSQKFTQNKNCKHFEINLRNVPEIYEFQRSKLVRKKLGNL